MKRAETYARLKARRPGLEAAETEIALSEAIASLIVDARVRAGLSQAELAARAGTTQARVSDVERGEGNPTLDTVSNLTRALGSYVDVAAVLHLMGNRLYTAVRTEHIATDMIETAVTTAGHESILFAANFAPWKNRISEVFTVGVSPGFGGNAILGFTMGERAATFASGIFGGAVADSTEDSEEAPEPSESAANSNLALAA